jgi:transcriptional regulator with XRE-family HTH domain
METSIRWDIDKLKSDLSARGWLAQDLAENAGVTPMTVSRVLRRLRANPRTMKKLAEALGHEPSRYVVDAAREAVAS